MEKIAENSLRTKWLPLIYHCNGLPDAWWASCCCFLQLYKRKRKKSGSLLHSYSHNYLISTFSRCNLCRKKSSFWITFITYPMSSLQEHFNHTKVKTLMSTLWCWAAVSLNGIVDSMGGTFLCHIPSLGGSILLEVRRLGARERRKN